VIAMSIKPIKSLGQNFLKDENVIHKIINSLKIGTDETLFEIGPGTGALTKYLINNDYKLIAIEKDTRAVEYLKNKYKSLSVINEDVLHFSFNEYDSFHIIGNLPYYITSEILHRLFLIHHKVKTAVFTIQKEVAERIVASPNKKNYGVLSVASQLYSAPRKLFNIPPDAFYPIPKVTSSVIYLDFLNEPVYKDSESLLKFVKACFSQRRKKISNSIKTYLASQKLDIKIFKGTSFVNLLDKRAENLSIEDFISLYEFIEQEKQ
jgi:16S rRNA (adenine1518-N6/adenine1519-N6)-dimethyltransferase